jgi:hypothetical protein
LKAVGSPHSVPGGKVELRLAIPDSDPQVPPPPSVRLSAPGSGGASPVSFRPCMVGSWVAFVLMQKAVSNQGSGPPNTGTREACLGPSCFPPTSPGVRFVGACSLKPALDSLTSKTLRGNSSLSLWTRGIYKGFENPEDSALLNAVCSCVWVYLSLPSMSTSQSQACLLHSF